MPGIDAALKELQAAFPAEIAAAEPAGPHPHMLLKPRRWLEIARFLRDCEPLRFNWLRCLTAIDHLEQNRFTLVYELHAIAPPDAPTAPAPHAPAPHAPAPPARQPQPAAHAADFWRLRHELSVRIHVDRADPHVPSVAAVWPAADWHEREAFDLFGVIFDGHPKLRRILCCDDWVGHPLRKDYEFPLEYHGIPGTTELAQFRIEH